MEQKDKFLSFVKKQKEYFILLGLVFVIFFVAFLALGFFPFGSRSMLISDADGQIGAFFKHLFAIFRGEASLFYSNALGGGFEIFSTLEYMLLSPFYLVCFLGGEANCYGMFNIAILLMFLFNAFVFVWFSKKHFKNISVIHRILLGLLFVFSGAVNLTYSFTTWLVYQGILLILIDAFKSLVEEKKIVRFTAILVWYVVNCFSIGAFTNLILVLLFVLYVMLLVEKENRKPVFVRLFVSYVIAACACVIILFPSIMAMLSSGRTAFGINYLKKNAVLCRPLNFVGLLIDGLFLIFAWSQFVFILIKQQKNRFKFFILAFCLLIFPNIFNLSLNLLCGGVYVGFDQRYHFIMLAFLLIHTLEFFNEKHQIKEVQTTPTLMKVGYGAMVFFVVLMILLLEIFQGFSLGRTIKTPVNDNVQLLTLFLCITALLGLLLLFTLFFNWRKLLSNKLVKFNTCLVIAVSCLINIICLFSGGYLDAKIRDEYTSLVSSQNFDGGRLKMFNFDADITLSLNDTGFGLQNMSLFTSLISNESQSFFNIGYSAGATMIATSEKSGTIVSDSLVGLNYYLTSTEQDRPYLTLIDKSENYYLYKNELATTGAILFDKNYSVPTGLTWSEVLEGINQSFGFEEKLFVEPNLAIENIDDKVESISSIKRITYTAPEDGILYFNFDLNELDEDKKQDYSYTNVYVAELQEDIMYDYKFMKAGETTTFVLFTRSSFEDDKLSAKFMKYNAAKNLCEELKQNELQFKTTKSGYEIVGEIASDKKLIVFTPNIKGMNYLVNGSAFEVSNEIGYFAGFELTEGSVKIEAYYSYSHTKTWLIVSAVLIVVAIVVAVLYHFTKFRLFETLIYWLFLILSGIILSIFYLFGIFLTFFRTLL